MSQALLALGSNLGDRRQLLETAIERLAATPGISEVRKSAWRATRAVGGPPHQSEFLNGAALVETTLTPQSLHAFLQQIEQELGRDRAQRWAPRTIDLDLLLFDDLVLNTPALQIPHPRMAWRRFVLKPAAEIAGNFVHPIIGWTVSQLLKHLNNAAPYVAISASALSDSPSNINRQSGPANHLAIAVAHHTGSRSLELSRELGSFPPLDSPSLTPSWAIEFLRRQAELLARRSWPPKGAPAISSFWIEDVLAAGDILWPGALQSEWEKLAPVVVPPKLLVILAGVSLPTTNSLAEQWSAAVHNRASRPGLGPVLWLNAEDPAAAETELTAAIESMN